MSEIDQKFIDGANGLRERSLATANEILAIFRKKNTPDQEAILVAGILARAVIDAEKDPARREQLGALMYFALHNPVPLAVAATFPEPGRN
jgi:hypothetical protein